MKKLKKAIVIMSLAIMTATTLMACGPKVSPDESTKIFLDVVLKDDKTNMSKIGMKDADYTEFKKAEDEEITKSLSMTGISSNVLTDEVKTKFKNDYLKGLTTLTYEVTPVSTDKDTAKVNVKITVFDMNKIVEDDKTKLMQEIAANPTMTQDEIYKESFNLVGEAVAAGTVKAEPKTVELTLTKQNNTWLPTETELEKLVTAILGQ